MPTICSARIEALPVSDDRQRGRLRLRQEQELRAAAENGQNLVFLLAAQGIERANLENEIERRISEDKRRAYNQRVADAIDAQRRINEAAIDYRYEGPVKATQQLLEKQRQEIEDAILEGRVLLPILVAQALERATLSKELKKQLEEIGKRRADQREQFPTGEGFFGSERAAQRLAGTTRSLDAQQLDELKKIRREEERTRAAIEQIKGGVAGI
ncbi:MAG: hypothetical protein KDA44_10420 [Planctomycetales bacterium]|nr:hypothetical protein [Planctomycetales bacterium]